MIEFIIVGGIALVGWAFFRAKHPRRSLEAIEREKSGRYYVPDPLAHLDVKTNDRSIVGRPVDVEPMRIVIETSFVSSAAMQKPKGQDYQFEIEYVDRIGNQTKRRIAWVHHEPDGEDTLLHAYCEIAQADRTFRSSRIQSCMNLWTGRKIKDLGRYFRNGSHLR